LAYLLSVSASIIPLLMPYLITILITYIRLRSKTVTAIN
jgi:hypothetical protein